MSATAASPTPRHAQPQGDGLYLIDTDYVRPGLAAAHLLLIDKSLLKYEPLLSRFRRGKPLTRQKFLLSLDPPAISAKLSIARDNTMAWDDKSNRISGACPGNGTDLIPVAQFCCDIAVGTSFAVRYFSQ